MSAKHALISLSAKDVVYSAYLLSKNNSTHTYIHSFHVSEIQNLVKVTIQVKSLNNKKIKEKSIFINSRMGDMPICQFRAPMASNTT